MSNFKITKNNAKQLKEEFQFHAENALIQIGMAGEGFAKKKITDENAIDTGLLRNSITWSIAGENANISTYKANKKDKKGKIRVGKYETKSPTSKEPAVFVGTNVKYAPLAKYAA